MNLRSSSGRTPLLEAVFGRQLEIARILVDAGADIDICDTKGTSVLHHMCFDRRPSLYFIRYLLSSKLIHKWISTLLKTLFRNLCGFYLFAVRWRHTEISVSTHFCVWFVCLFRSCYHLRHLSQTSSNGTASWKGVRFNT